MDIVNEILSNEAKNLKSTRVEKHLELQFDIGSLLAIDENELEVKKLK